MRHFGLHNCSQSCTRALLCSLLYSLLGVWRRAWIHSMPLPCISHCPVLWKSRRYGWMAPKSREVMLPLLLTCLAVTYLLQSACFLFMVAESELSIAKPGMHLSLMVGYSQSFSFWVSNLLLQLLLCIYSGFCEVLSEGCTVWELPWRAMHFDCGNTFWNKARHRL